MSSPSASSSVTVYNCDSLEHGNGSVTEPDVGTSEYGADLALSVAMPTHAAVADEDAQVKVTSAVLNSSAQAAVEGALNDVKTGPGGGGGGGASVVSSGSGSSLGEGDGVGVTLGDGVGVALAEALMLGLGVAETVGAEPPRLASAAMTLMRSTTTKPARIHTASL